MDAAQGLCFICLSMILNLAQIITYYYFIGYVLLKRTGPPVADHLFPAQSVIVSLCRLKFSICCDFVVYYSSYFLDFVDVSG